MKEEVNQKFKKLLDKMKNFFTEKETVYIADKEGDHVAIRKEEYDSLDEKIGKFLDEINQILEGLDEEQSKKIKEAIEILRQMEFSDLDPSEIEKICKEAKQEIEDSAQINIEQAGPVREDNKGGYMGVVSRTESGEKDDLGTPGRPTGGFMLPRNEKLAKEFAGNYLKTDNGVEVIDNMLQKLISLVKTNSKENEALRQKAIDRLDSTEIADIAVKSAIDKPEGTKIKEVHRNKGLKRLISLILATTLAAGAFSIGFSMKSENLTIPLSIIQEYERMNPGADTDEIIHDIIGELGILEYHNAFTAKEANTIGKSEEELDQMGLENLDPNSPEIGASEEVTNYTKEYERIEQEIQKIEDDYKNIKNPTNLDWIEYQEKIMEKNVELLNLNKAVLNQTNEYADAKVDFNNEHISNGISSEAQERHENENDNNSRLINDNKNKINEIDNQIQEYNDKKEFINKLKSLKQLEEIKDIAAFAETLYNFKNIDACKDMTLEQFMGIIDVVDANLFIALVNNKKDVNSLEEFLEEYEKVELGYKSYTEVYSEGDKSKVDEDKYVVFFDNALNIEDFKDIGEDSKTKGLNDISDINREYYETYGRVDSPDKDIKTGFFHKLKERVNNIVDKTRREDYGDMMGTIKTLRNNERGDNTKDTGGRENG